METSIKKTMTQESWKYLYGILSRIFFYNEEDLQVVNNIFNTIEPVAFEYDTKDSLLDNELIRLKQMYKTQITREATEQMIQDTMDKMEGIQKEKEELASKQTDIEIPKSYCEFIANVIRNFMKTKFVDEQMRSEGVIGRHDIRLRVQVLDAFNIN